MSEITQVENYYKDLLTNNNVQFLVELVEDESQYITLRNLLPDYLQRRASQQPGFTWRNVAINMPYSTAMYLVMHGLYGSIENGFWQGLGIKGTHQRDVSEEFIKILKKHGLPTFQSVVINDNALRHITPILLHAGIPRACMNDYFQYFLMRYVRRVRRHIGLDEYCDNWLAQSWPMVAEPVKRFMKYGGSFARDWIERTAEMASILFEYDRTNRHTTDYPAHLASQFRVAEWVSTQFWELLLDRRTRSVRAQSDEDIAEYSRPQVYLTADSEILIELPRQVVRPDSSQSLIWRISTSNTAYDIMPIVRPAGRHVHVDARYMPLDDIQDLFGLTIALQYGDSVLAQWSFAREVYVFRQYNTMNRLMFHDAQVAKIQLPNQPVWLLTAKNYNIHADNALIPATQASQQAWLYELNTPSIQTLTIDGTPLQIKEDDAQLHARLIGGQQLAFVQEEGMAPVYAVPPCVLLPWSRNMDKEAQRDDWYVTITHQPSGNRIVMRQKVAQLSGVMLSPAGIELDLAAIIPQSSLGQYQITLRSQLGRLFMPPLQLVYVPELRLVSQMPVILPDAVTHSESDQWVRPEIHLARVPAEWAIEGASWDASAQKWRCPVETDNHRVTLTFVHTQDNQQRCDIQLTIPRLYIAYLNKNDRLVDENCTRSEDMAWYENVQPCIELQLSPESLATNRTFMLSVEVERESVQENPIRLIAQTDSKRLWFRFDTRQIIDSIRRAPSNVNVRLVIHRADGSAIKYDLLTLQKPVNTTDMQVEIKPVLDRWRVATQWSSPQSHASWKYVIWSITKPWQEPVISDVVHGQTFLKPIIEPGKLFPGYTYAVGFMSVGGDKHRIPDRPPQAPGIQTFEFHGTLTSSQIQSAIDQIVNQMYGSKAIMRDEQTFERVRIHELTKLLLFLYGVCVYMADKPAEFAAILSDHVLPKIINVKPLELLTAVLRVRARVNRDGNTDYALFERMIYDMNVDLADLLIKIDVSRSLWDTQIAEYLKRSLEHADHAFLRRVDVSYQISYQEPFFASIVHPAQVVNMLPVLATAPFALASAYENVLMVAGTYSGDVYGWKQSRVTQFRHELMPTLLLWLANEYYAKHRVPDNRLWDNPAIMPMLYKYLDEYTVEMGDLRDYLLNKYEQGLLYTPTTPVRNTRTRRSN